MAKARPGSYVVVTEAGRLEARDHFAIKTFPGRTASGRSDSGIMSPACFIGRSITLKRSLFNRGTFSAT
jgi:hypothetical protein